MSRPRDRATILVGIFTILASMAVSGCEGLDGRKRTREGNRLYRETKFIDAAAEYEEALKTVPSPIIHYNAGLAYAKMFQPGPDDAAVRLGIKGTFVCNSLPNTKIVPARVCVKDDDRRYDDCDEKAVCASSYQCTQTELCTYAPSQIAALAADHFGKWLEANGKDDETRAIMTQVWEDSGQSKLALDYWNKLLAESPGNTTIMGNLAGINLRAGNWRESVDLYLEVAAKTDDLTQKVSMYQNIGNVAWSKLNSKTLDQAESVELADMGIGALQKAAALTPKNPKVWGLQGSLLNFRALAQGASWAAFVERAAAQDPQRTSRVLNEEAKKARDGVVPGAPPATPPTTPSPAAAGGSAEKAGG